MKPKEPTAEQLERLAKKKLPDANTYEGDHFTAMVENPYWSAMYQNTHIYKVEFMKVKNTEGKPAWEFQYFTK